MKARSPLLLRGDGLAGQSRQEESLSMARTRAPASPSSLCMCLALVSTTFGCDSDRIPRSSVSGESSAMGINAPPAFRVPMAARMYSGHVSMNMPTGESVETPQERR